MPRRPRIAPKPAVLLAAALVGVLVSGSAAARPVAPVAAPAAAPQVPDPYYPSDGNVGYDVLHYDIRDSYRFDDQHLAGTTTIRLKPLQELTSFNFDLLLAVDSVEIDGVAAAFEKPDLHELTITPEAPLASGEPVEVTVSYQGFPDDLRWAGESNWLANPLEVVTMNEPHMAAWWFPSNDHPSDKASFDIRITTDKRHEVISNGARVGRSVEGETATTHWRMTDPMATYLAFFAAGEFAIDQGRAHGLRYYNAVSKRLDATSEDNAIDLLHESARITAWLQDQFGDYPFATTGGVVTSLDVYFALENQTRPTYPAYTSRSTVVHELAHQWFGDSVAVARWQDIWLNEGFATYAEALYHETHGGSSTDRWLHRNYNSSGNAFWGLNIADPCNGTGPCSFNSLFAYEVYVRGGMALAALRNRIGHADFRHLLRRWAAVHEGGNVTTEQFVDLAMRISGQRLRPFFHAWLRDDERPPATSQFGL